jgi:hypothetical protein
MDAIDNELQDRGLPSTQSKGAEDLDIIKQAVVQKLAVRLMLKAILSLTQRLASMFLQLGSMITMIQMAQRLTE